MTKEIKLQNTITREKLEKYFDVTGRALKKLKLAAPSKTHLDTMAKDFLNMATTYYEDAKHFYEKKDYFC